MIPIFVGFDAQAEPVAYHTFCHSVITRSTVPVSFIPLSLNLLPYKETHVDGSNAFIYSRFLVPYLMGFSGWAVFVDGDMVCLDDIKKLWDMRDHSKAVMVAKHSYETKYPEKYLGAKNENYPRKNWSSVILWNCSHYMNRGLTPEFVQTASGKTLHRFEWVEDDRIGEIPLEWNWLASEYEKKPNVSLVHYTIGTPCFKEYSRCDYSEAWHKEHDAMNHSLQRWEPVKQPLVGVR